MILVGVRGGIVCVMHLGRNSVLWAAAVRACECVLLLVGKSDDTGESVAVD